LSEQFLGFYETGKFKELYKIVGTHYWGTGSSLRSHSFHLSYCMKFKELLLREEPGKVDWWSLFAPVMARLRFVFGSSSVLLARRVLVLFVFAIDFVLVWTLVLWYTGRRFRVHWTLIFQFVWALVSPLCLGPYFRPRRNGALHL
jgi:hypothetical protein